MDRTVGAGRSEDRREADASSLTRARDLRLPAAMTSPLTAPIPAFVNARAGSADKAKEALAGAAGFEMRVVEPDKLVDALKAAMAEGAPRVLISGGDGSIATAAGTLVGSDTALAVLPGGTLNHFAKDHGIPIEADDALALAVEGKVVPTDMAFVNDHLFHGTSSLGSYIRFVRLREEMESRLGYAVASVVALVRVLATLRTYKVTLLVEGVERTYHTPAIFIGVGERELRIPHLGSRLPDGRRGLHVLVARGGRARQLLAVALLAITRGVRPASRTRWLDSYLVEKCRVDPPRHGVTISVDGEMKDLKAPLEYRLERDALGVVRPEQPGQPALGTRDSV
jgi:diacylglycerol kinase family enzyme